MGMKVEFSPESSEILKEKLDLQAACATFFWAFEETCSEQKLLLQKGILPLVTDGLMSNPGGIQFTGPSSMQISVQDVHIRLVGLLGG